MSKDPAGWYMDETHLYLVIFHVNDDLAFFNAALKMARRRPPGIRLRHWFMSADGLTSYAIWEAAEPHMLMGILDVEFDQVAEYDLSEVHLLWGE